VIPDTEDTPAGSDPALIRKERESTWHSRNIPPLFSIARDKPLL